MPPAPVGDPAVVVGVARRPKAAPEPAAFVLVGPFPAARVVGGHAVLEAPLVVPQPGQLAEDAALVARLVPVADAVQVRLAEAASVADAAQRLVTVRWVSARLPLEALAEGPGDLALMEQQVPLVSAQAVAWLLKNSNPAVAAHPTQ